ncbi:hypothetical protein RYX36_003786 [Vicia faba]
MADQGYKILIDAVNDGYCVTFVLWDQECTKSLEVTAAHMRTTMLEASLYVWKQL